MREPALRIGATCGQADRDRRRRAQTGTARRVAGFRARAQLPFSDHLVPGSCGQDEAVERLLPLESGVASCLAGEQT